MQENSVYDLVDRINDEILLPGIQRGFEWNEDQIVALIDSLLRENPVGLIHFENRNGDIEDHRVLREIITKYGNHPHPPKDYQYRPARITPGKRKNVESRNTLLVLDGQQRLTAMNIALRGSYKKKVSRNWASSRQLYIDLLSRGNGDDSAGSLKYNMKFAANRPRCDSNSFWVWMGRIYEAQTRAMRRGTNSSNFSEILKQELAECMDKECDMYNANTIEINNALNDIESALSKTPVDTRKTKLANTQDLIRIFSRHQEGEPLDKQDLALASLTDDWLRKANLDAREEITSLVDDLKDNYGDGKWKMGSKMVINLVAISVGINKSGYQATDFGPEELELAKKKWEQNAYKMAFENALELLEDFGFNKVETSAGLVEIVAYYFLKNPHAPVGETPRGEKNKKLLHFWACRSLLEDSFPRRAEVIDKIVEKIDTETAGKTNAILPLKAISNVDTSQYSLEMNRHLVEKALTSNKTMNSSKSFSILSMLYWPTTAVNTEHELDHIISKSKLEEQKFDYTESIRSTIDDHGDSVLNRQVLLFNDNRRKSDMPLHEWLNQTPQKNEYKEKHCIPKNESLYTVEQFDEFIEQRKELMIDAIMNRYNDQVKEVMSESEPKIVVSD